MIKLIENDTDAETSEILSCREATRDFFGPDSPLRNASAYGGNVYEERPQQKEMAERVANAFVSGTHLCVEAPTGIGKTFAYLVPAIYAVKEKNMPVVVSTHTISLQEQIAEKDLPLLKRLMSEDFSFAIAKGRSNYLCLRRLQAAAGHQQEFLPSEELVPELEHIRRWSNTTRDGSRSDLDFVPDASLWESVCCEAGNCLNTKCEFYSQCFFMKARNRLLKADVIVVNHALYFSDLAMKMEEENAEGGIIPQYAFVVFDEGHFIEDMATEHLGIHITAYSIQRILKRLYTPEHERGLLSNKAYGKIQETVTHAIEQTTQFFDQLREWLESS